MGFLEYLEFFAIANSLDPALGISLITTDFLTNGLWLLT